MDTKWCLCNTAVKREPDFNEYVWIPIPDSSKFVRKAFTTPSKGEQVLSEETSNGAYYEDKTAQEYRDMVYSVGINKGFYISRYEASEMNSTTAQSKRGQNPWVDIPQTEAKTVSANMKAEINSHLIYGIEWDSILQWLLDSKAIISTSDSETDTINLDYIQNDSSSWGNYGKIRPGETFWPPGEEVALTATSEYWKVNNIYDLAGNAEELTQEERLGMSTGIALNAVSRGGNLYNEGDSSPVAERTFSVETSGSINYFGFRVAFYV